MVATQQESIQEYLESVLIIPGNHRIIWKNLNQSKIFWTNPEKSKQYKIIPNLAIRNTANAFDLIPIFINEKAMRTDVNNKLRMKISWCIPPPTCGASYVTFRNLINNHSVRV